MSTDNGNKLVPAERAQGEPIAPVLRTPDRGLYGYGYGYGYAGAAQEESGGLNIREYLRILTKNKWLILTLVVVTTTVVAVASYKVEDEYVAMATVLVGDENPNMIPNSQPIYVYDFDGKRFKTRLRLLQMPDLIRESVVEMDLQNNPNVFSERPATLSDAFWSLFRPRATAPPKPATAPNSLEAPLDPKAPLDEATTQRLDPYVGVVMSGLSISEVRDTQLINISFKHHDPEIAAKVANTVAEVFIKEDLSQRVGIKASASDFMSKRIADLQTNIRSGEERLLNYAKTHEILSLDEGQNTVVKRLTELNDELLKAESERRDLEVQRESLQKAGVADDILKLPIAQADQGAQQLSLQLSTQRQKLAELRQTYQDEWPEIKSLKESIAGLEADLEKVKKRLLQTYEAQYQGAVKKEQVLRADFESQRGATMQQNEDAIQYRIIQQEVETNKKLLDTILQRSKEVDISAASESSPILLKNRAVAPGGPSGPDRNRWILTSFALALFAGVGIAFGREYLDQTIRSIEDVDRVVRLPSLGIIPALSAGQKKSFSRRALASGDGQNGAQQGLITALEAKSSAAEAYRQLRTSVLLSSAGHTSKLLLVTSSQPREGKTTTAVNTAISLAQTGASTLIIDCDMRKPRVHQLLNASNHMGVSLYLSGQNEDLSVLVQPHQIPNLSVLPCGPVPPNPAELLGSEQMRKLLGELLDQFDHIVIDSPPVVSFADPVILSTMVDGVILVVRGGFSSRGIVLRSRQILTDVGAKIYGVVLNDADMKSSDSYYYYSSYYGSYYGKDGDAGTNG